MVEFQEKMAFEKEMSIRELEMSNNISSLFSFFLSNKSLIVLLQGEFTCGKLEEIWVYHSSGTSVILSK